jgi:Zn-dependent protease
MLLGEPPPTQADLHFRFLGFPVRVHPFFWVVAILMGLGPGKADPKDVLLWVAVVFASILVHELGHAFMQRFYGGHPWITLHGFGGLASCNDGPRSPGKRILILLAGPGAGFLLAAVTVAAIKLSGHAIGLTWTKEVASPETLGIWRIWSGPLGPFTLYYEALKSDTMSGLVWDILQVNIMWGFINLLPVYPLDGGQISRELFNLQNPRSGNILALQVSAATAILVAVYAILNGRFYVALLFGYLAYGNFQSIQFTRNNWR